MTDEIVIGSKWIPIKNAPNIMSYPAYVIVTSCTPFRVYYTKYNEDNSIMRHWLNQSHLWFYKNYKPFENNSEYIL